MVTRGPLAGQGVLALALAAFTAFGPGEIRAEPLPAALSGIGTACMLGMSRSIGETMVVLMVAGGAGIIPSSIFDPVRPMPAAIAAEMAEAPFRGEHYHALFAIGMLLFLFTLGFNILAQFIAEKKRQALD